MTNVDTTSWSDGLICAGVVIAICLDQPPAEPPPGRVRHRYGAGPFAKLRMPALPSEPGFYVWTLDGVPVYAGETRATLWSRLGPNGYATISTYNTLARSPGRRNGGQQTNCRINALANRALSETRELAVWYQTTAADQTKAVESSWMRRHGKPRWNLRDER